MSSEKNHGVAHVTLSTRATRELQRLRRHTEPVLGSMPADALVNLCVFVVGKSVALVAQGDKSIIAQMLAQKLGLGATSFPRVPVPPAPAPFPDEPQPTPAGVKKSLLGVLTEMEQDALVTGNALILAEVERIRELLDKGGPVTH